MPTKESLSYQATLWDDELPEWINIENIQSVFKKIRINHTKMPTMSGFLAEVRECIKLQASVPDERSLSSGTYEHPGGFKVWSRLTGLFETPEPDAEELDYWVKLVEAQQNKFPVNSEWYQKYQWYKENYTKKSWLYFQQFMKPNTKIVQKNGII